VPTVKRWPRRRCAAMENPFVDVTDDEVDRVASMVGILTGEPVIRGRAGAQDSRGPGMPLSQSISLADRLRADTNASTMPDQLLTEHPERGALSLCRGKSFGQDGHAAASLGFAYSSLASGELLGQLQPFVLEVGYLLLGSPKPCLDVQQGLVVGRVRFLHLGADCLSLLAERVQSALG